MGRDRRRALGAAALAVSAALAVAGCTSAGPAARGTGPAARVSAAARPVAPATPATPRQRAVADAAAILAAFVPPPGARRLAKAPDVAGLPGGPISTLGSIALVDDVAFWEAPGQPLAVLAWEQAHVSRRFTPEDEDFGPPSWDRTFSLAPIPGVLNARDLVVEVTAAGGGQTAIRVDAQVAWQPPRPASERVPAAARVVTIGEVPGLLPVASPVPAPVTVTSAAAVARLAALVDGLALSTRGPGASCAAGVSLELVLTFRARPGGAALAVARGPAPCGLVLFAIGGRQQPALAVTGTFVTQALAIARLHGKLGARQFCGADAFSPAAALAWLCK